jgi:prolyl 4-hydroxylase
MKKQIPADWQDWIQTNTSRGCDKDGMVKILLEHDFDPAAIVTAMRYIPHSSELIAVMNAKLAAVDPTNTRQEAAAFEAIDGIGLPYARRLLTDKARFCLLDDFLTAPECEAIIGHIRAHHQRSTITSRDEPDRYFRTSKTSNLSQLGDAGVDALDKRIAHYMGFEPARSEGIQGQYYEVGDEFKSHTDYFEPGTDEFRRFGGERGQRTWTFMVYLNDVEAGGETEFPQLGISVKPKRGMVAMWNSLNSDGSVNPNTLHCAKPVVRGEKYVITKWFRTHGSMRQPFVPEPWRKVPLYTREGFRKAALAPALAQAISNYYHQQISQSQPEQTDAIGRYIRTNDGRTPAHMIELDDNMRAFIGASLLPELEAWVGRKLRITAVYGIRDYQRGAVLDMHVDRIDTHHVSAIINVAQQVEKPWALHIDDHLVRRHAAYLQPGEMLMYESARLQHGRPQPLQGDHFANIFVHALPV